MISLRGSCTTTRGVGQPGPDERNGNKYVYADNNPLSNVDVDGLASKLIGPGDSGWDDEDDTGWTSPEYAESNSDRKAVRQMGGLLWFGDCLGCFPRQGSFDPGDMGRMAPPDRSASAQDAQIMKDAVANRAKGGADPVEGRHYYGTTNNPKVESSPAESHLKGAAGRETVYEKFGPFKYSTSRRPTWIVIYNNPGQ